MNIRKRSLSKMEYLALLNLKFVTLSLFLFLALFSTSVFAQVGIGTTTPKASLHIVGNPSDTSAKDGIIIPHLTLSELQAKTYTTEQEGAIIYVRATSGTSIGQTVNIDAVGLYYLDNQAVPVWQKINIGDPTATIGDIKTGIQTIDHNGWVKLDGRATNTLTTNQQTQAGNLGLTVSLPNATNTQLTQNGSALGSVSGSNTKTINQNQLPNVRLQP